MSDADLIGISLILTLGIVVILIGVGTFYSLGFDSGVGEQTGYISEVEQSGVFWRPAEIRLISIEPTYSSTDTVWYYGTPNQEITDKAKNFMKTHEKVIVKYEIRHIAERWNYANRVIITDIIPVITTPS